ncbi:hypothetical protein C8A03DRAFT_37529 [Achaetomium macrosporum]|uniref:Uncharacterized protein n=1 Tax=Achaetomium macrosporum TaxID=79813 RepID=A0AAN7H8S3_9PEZI|nr:hypothetical protein C8A03DRAFT_37529 [Achaetomium macrosporum]
MASLAADEKAEYARIPSQDDCQDEESISQNPPIEHEFKWRQRFYILLVCFISAIAAIIGGGAYKLRTAGSQYSCPILPTNHGDVQIPYSPALVKYVNKFLVGDPDTPKFMGQPLPA